MHFCRLSMVLLAVAAVSVTAFPGGVAGLAGGVAGLPGGVAGRIVLLGDFDTGWELDWQQQRLARRATRFRVADDAGDAVLRADSHEAAAAFWRRVEAGPAETLTLSWRWRVSTLPMTRGHERSRRGDDYAARLLVAFDEGFLEGEARAISYVWAHGEAVGASYPNPYHREVATLVLRNSEDGVGAWQLESRDVLADYQRLFGEPAEHIYAVAFIVDTDNTSSRVTSWLDEMVLSIPERP